MEDDEPIERLRRRLVARRTRVEGLLTSIATGTPAPEELHVGHRELRRFRLDGRLWADLVPPGRSAGYDETDLALRDLARAVGRVRNYDVGVELLTGWPPRGTKEFRSPDRQALGRALAARALTGRRSLARDVANGTAEHLLEGTERPLRAALPGAASQRLADRLDEMTTVRLARLERTLAKVYRKPSVPRLHRLRIELRSVRFLDQTRRRVVGASALPALEKLRPFQLELGRLHDWDVLRESAQELGPATLRGRVDPVLKDRVRATRKKLVRSLDWKPFRRSFSDLLAAAPG